MERKASFVSLDEKSEFLARYVKLHSVSALYLKGDVIRGGGGGVHSVTRAVMVVMVGHVGALGNNRCGDGETGGIVVFVPL